MDGKAPVIAHGLTKPTPVLPECSSLPETMKNHYRLFSGKFRQISGAKKRIITRTNQLKMTALTTRNSGAPKQNKHPTGLLQLSGIFQSFAFSLDSFPYSASEGQWVGLPHISLSTSLQGISFPLRNICTHEGCSGNNALGEDTTQQAPEGLEHLLEVSKRSKVLIYAVIHPEINYAPPSWNRFTHTALPLQSTVKCQWSCLRSRGRTAHSS